MIERHNPFRVSKIIDGLIPLDPRLKEVVVGVNGYVWNQRPYAYEYGITMAWYRIKESGGNIDKEYIDNLRGIFDLTLNTSRFDFVDIAWSGSRTKPQLIDNISKQSIKQMLKKIEGIHYLSDPKNIKELMDFLTGFTETLADSGILIPDYNNFDSLFSVFV